MCVQRCVRGGTSRVYMYIHKGTRDGSDFIKGVSCTNMYRNVHVIIANDSRPVTQSGA